MTFDLVILANGIVVAERRIEPASVADLAGAVTQAAAAYVEQYGVVDVRVMREGWERPAMMTAGLRTASAAKPREG